MNEIGVLTVTGFLLLGGIEECLLVLVDAYLVISNIFKGISYTYYLSPDDGPWITKNLILLYLAFGEKKNHLKRKKNTANCSFVSGELPRKQTSQFSHVYSLQRKLHFAMHKLATALRN